MFHTYDEKGVSSGKGSICLHMHMCVCWWGLYTSATIIDKDRASAINFGGKFTTLAIADVGVCLYRGEEALARGVSVEMDCRCGRDDENAV